MARSLDEIVPPLSARSMILSVLLGSTPPSMAAHQLVAVGAHFGVAASSVRVALSRMVASGELDSTNSTYTLSPQHMLRQRTTEARISPRRLAYTGMWRTVVLLGPGRAAADRAQTRAMLTEARYAELREGVWMRPDNLANEVPLITAEHTTMLAMPADDRALARMLWNTEVWAAEAREVLNLMRQSTDHMVQLRAAAAAVRLLELDPALPDELTPERYPADELRWAYEDFRRDLTTTYIESLRPERGAEMLATQEETP
ncbi:PaaX domain-containing protein, C- domain protein [Leucobacter chinensis]|uniref:PaaX domain-containing protein, C- domain protein n=1 Tax=Leucobacter chinensis TaxID=2851010 RepID=UPI001C21DE5F|nr:PaaX domain-containing protein, C- domain protein [Leucobacter chinensis]